MFSVSLPLHFSLSFFVSLSLAYTNSFSLSLSHTHTPITYEGRWRIVSINRCSLSLSLSLSRELSPRLTLPNPPHPPSDASCTPRIVLPNECVRVCALEFMCGCVYICGRAEGTAVHKPSLARRKALDTTAVVCVCGSVWQCVAVCCSVLQCVAVCCSVLQRVAVCCRVVQ